MGLDKCCDRIPHEISLVPAHQPRKFLNLSLEFVRKFDHFGYHDHIVPCLLEPVVVGASTPLRSIRVPTGAIKIEHALPI